jgi:uncharacterized protein (TIGR00369 family)
MTQIFGADIPFATFCGIEPVESSEARTVLRVTLRPEHTNNFGIAHGGLTSTLLDIAMGSAARHASNLPVMTLDLQVAFIAPGRGVLTAEAKIVRAGRSVVFCEGEVRSDDGELVAKASGLFKPVRPRAD